jgi:LPPG:FO 2-phospho-L-lactate transferase
MIAVLTGGTGGAKLVQGLMQVAPQEELTCIVNTGDDLVWWGLRVSPDLDSITYALAGLLSRARGWGIEGDTFECAAAMERLGWPAWFRVGDRDLATHVLRTELLRQGRTLSEVTQELVRRLGVRARVLPMSDHRVETRVSTPGGELSFEEYFVRERWQVEVTAVRFAGAEQARPAPGVLEAIAQAEAVLLAPSNPVTSLGPILEVPGIREALRATAAPAVAVSPIIAGAAVSGPAAALMRVHGLPASAAGVAGAYADFLDVLLMDESDAASAPEVEALGVRAVCAPTRMTSDEAKAGLARAALAAGRKRTQVVMQP